MALAGSAGLGRARPVRRTLATRYKSVAIFMWDPSARTVPARGPGPRLDRRGSNLCIYNGGARAASSPLRDLCARGRPARLRRPGPARRGPPGRTPPAAPKSEGAEEKRDARTNEKFVSFARMITAFLPGLTSRPRPGLLLHLVPFLPFLWIHLPSIRPTWAGRIYVPTARAWTGGPKTGRGGAPGRPGPGGAFTRASNKQKKAPEGTATTTRVAA